MTNRLVKLMKDWQIYILLGTGLGISPKTRNRISVKTLEPDRERQEQLLHSTQRVVHSFFFGEARRAREVCQMELKCCHPKNQH